MKKKSIQVEDVELCEWLGKAVQRRNYTCEGWNCARFIDLSCRTCKFDPYTAKPPSSKGFVTALLCLKQYLGKDLATFIVENYAIITDEIELQCGYSLLNDGRVMHTHCYLDEVLYEEKQSFSIASATLRIRK